MSRSAHFVYQVAVAGLLTAATNVPCGAQPMLPCGLMNQPAATLLLPYFEVDLERPAGRGTLFSVGNVDSEAALAHAVIWTNWGHPALSFDFFVPAGGVLSFNVRDLLQGRLPRTFPPASAPGEDFGGCTAPLTQPKVDSEALTALLTGRADREDGLCYSEPVGGGNVATGYITIDVVQQCSGAAVVTPNDPGYFGDCASGLASNDNVLWGDFFLVDPAADSAQGEKLVPVIADQWRFGSEHECVDPPCGWRISESFYVASSNRMPLPRSYEARFLRGGGFEGGTELVVWIKGSVEPRVCGEASAFGEAPNIQAHFRNEGGTPLTSHTLESAAQSFRVSVGGDRLPIAQRFGCVELSAEKPFEVGSYSYAEDRQLWVMPLMSGAGRYSVGLSTVPVADFCPW